MKRASAVLSVLLVVASVITSCGPTPAPQIVEVTKEVEKTVVQTVEVEKTVVETVEVEKEVEKTVVETVVVETGVNLKAVPRERTLVWAKGGKAGAWNNSGICNPYAVGFSHQRANNAWLEGLEYYSVLSNEYIPWLATGHEYNADYTELTIHIREGVEWSDGVPFTAEDVAFTLNMLKQYAPKLRNSGVVAAVVKDAVAVDPLTLKITFNVPQPRFYFVYLTYKFDSGIYIVPEHIFKDVEDVTTFTFFDPEKGWPVVTGPYQILVSTPTQVIADRRDDWWGAKTGFMDLPEVERIVLIPETDTSMLAQLSIQNQLDTMVDLHPREILAVLDANPAVITHTPNPPYGYVSYWEVNLGWACSQPPLNNPDIRWAISDAIDREGLIQVAYDGAGIASYLPFPDYPALQPYFDGISDLLEKYPITYDLEKSAALMEKNGYVKDKEGFWSLNGERLHIDFNYNLTLFGDIAPILMEQLRMAGFEVDAGNPANGNAAYSEGWPNVMWLDGVAGTTGDSPYSTLNGYNARELVPPGEVTWANNWRWGPEDYSAIVDEMGTLTANDPKEMELFRQAMEIWLREMPSPPIIQWIHRIPMNTTYWTNWPTEDNPYIEGAMWYITAPLMLHNLKAVKPDPRGE
jgi:peptide/nickel transport system substrate-binding protein